MYLYSNTEIVSWYIFHKLFSLHFNTFKTILVGQLTFHNFLRITPVVHVPPFAKHCVTLVFVEAKREKPLLPVSHFIPSCLHIRGLDRTCFATQCQSYYQVQPGNIL